MLFKYFLCCILIVLVIVGCNRNSSITTNSDISTSVQKMKDVANNNFTNPYDLNYSKDSSYVCIYDTRKIGSNGAFTTNSFVLYDLSSDKIVFKGQHNRVSEMLWTDIDKFKITTVAGMIKDNESGITYHIYNLSSGTKNSKKGK